MSEHVFIEPLDLLGWIGEHAAEFVPPVSNKVLWPDRDIMFMVVAGPNARNDFHVNPGDEIFLQLRGTIRVDVMDDDGTRRRHLVHEGETMLVPAGTPHSPLRPADTWGVVLERRRGDAELDELRWYCEACSTLAHSARFHVADIETELAAAIGAVNASAALRTCPACGSVLPVPGPFTL